jgi:asparagine synthase (glutamine-hydrolysing)
MCGIAGIAALSASPELLSTARTMSDLMVHRGPDSSGSVELGNIALAMRRLSIIDLNTGDQPVSSHDGSVTTVFNGEIYNYAELKATLENKGHKFHTTSDTEVIANGWLEWGSELVPKLRGMFSIALYDKRSDALHLVRDRFGEKPLFYKRTHDSLIFASELTALVRGAKICPALDHDQLLHYMAFGFTSPGRSLFKDIVEVSPATILTWRQGTISEHRYYSPIVEPDPQLSDEKIAIEAVRNTLENSVKRTTVADVPVGTFLSGGIDSAAVTAMMQKGSPNKVKTFTVAFGDPIFDESKIAREVANHLGTDHTEINSDDLEFSNGLVDSIVRHVGQPLADSSAIPTLLVSRAARNDVKVCLTGDGGDEMFGGYRNYQRAATADRIALLSKPVLSLARGVLQTIGGGSSTASRLSTAIELAKLPADQRYQRLEMMSLPNDFSSLTNQSFYEWWNTRKADRTVTQRVEDNSASPMRKRMLESIYERMSQGYLVKTDRMSMAASLELRAPLLDADLAELSMKLPDKFLIQNNIGKFVLRESVRDILPGSLFDQPKSGFSIPIHRFQNQEYREMASEMLDSKSDVMGLLDPNALKALVSASLDGERNQWTSKWRSTNQLWAMIQLWAWDREFKPTLSR